jgi:hypothetical protein
MDPVECREWLIAWAEAGYLPPAEFCNACTFEPDEGAFSELKAIRSEMDATPPAPDPVLDVCRDEIM